MAKETYLSLYFDNLSKTAALLQDLMGELDNDEDPSEDILANFSEVRLEIKASVDERAATIRALATCEKELAQHKKVVDHKLKMLKKIQDRLKSSTLACLASFQNQPFRGDFCQLQANKTKGIVDISIFTSKASISNVIDPDLYAATDIPSSCLKKVTYYYIDKASLYGELKAGLEIADAKILENRALKIKDLA